MLPFLCVFVICGCSTLKEVTENDVKFGDDFITLDNATNEPFTGVVVKYYPDGKIESKQPYKNGKVHGTYISWDTNGQMRNCFEYINDRRGKLKCWYANGNLFIDTDMNEGVGQGYQIVYYATGEKWSEWRWDHEKGTHTLKEWLRNGRLVAEGTFENFRKNRNGTFGEWEYEIPVIKKYSKGELIATTDIDGNSVDIAKLRKKTEEEMTKEGYGEPIGFKAEFK